MEDPNSLTHRKPPRAKWFVIVDCFAANRLDRESSFPVETVGGKRGCTLPAGIYPNTPHGRAGWKERLVPGVECSERHPAVRSIDHAKIRAEVNNLAGTRG